MHASREGALLVKLTMGTHAPTSKRPSKRGSAAGARFLYVFGGVFALAGIGSGVAFLSDALRSGDVDRITGAIVVPVLFTVIGVGLIALGVYSARSAARVAELKARHPDAPWMWNEQWASGRINGGGKAMMIAGWGIAFVWNAISAPILFSVPAQLARKGMGKEAIALLFPLVGCGLLVFAIRATLAWRKYRLAIFEPKSLPGVIGGRLEGVIHTSTTLDAPDGLKLRLVCVNKVTRSSGSKGSSTHESIRWESERQLAQSDLHAGRMGSAIPVSFVIPIDCQETNDENPRNEIFWRLEAHASTPGVDFEKNFLVPVFRTEESSEQVTLDEDELPLLLQPSSSTETLPLSGVRFQADPGGGMKLHFSAARNKSAAASITVFAAIWTGVCGFLWQSDAPLLFPIVFSAFDLLFFCMMVVAWAGAAEIDADAAGIRSRRTLFGVGGTKHFDRSEIAAVRERIGMQIGTRVYYGLQIQTPSGKTHGLGRDISDKREAEGLAAALERAVGVNRSGVDPGTN
jgi:hypothetical protein